MVGDPRQVTYKTHHELKNKKYNKGNIIGYIKDKKLINKCEIDEIRTGAAIQNPASWKIMEKFGFEKQNYTKMVEYTYLDEPVEDYQYRLTKEIYLNRNNKLKKYRKYRSTIISRLL